MRKIAVAIYVVLLALSFTSCKDDSKEKLPKLFDRDAKSTEQAGHAFDTANYTTIKWLDSSLNMGTIKKGKLVSLTYRFQNTGDKPLYIMEVKPTCGCTIADYTKGAVLPGKQGTVIAKYDSNHGVAGSVTKTIIASSNTVNAPNYVLNFRGEIVDPK